MLKNYFKIAYRNLKRDKLFSFINIFGLALSMSVCLLVLMRIKEQVSYDTFHPLAERTYRIITQITNKQGSEYRLATTPLPLGPTLLRDYNCVEKAVRIYPLGSKPAIAANKDLQVRSAFTDPAFFEIFGFRLKSGNPHTVLTAPYSMVLSAETATRYFGDKNPLGQVFSFGDLGTFQVTGVIEHSKKKSHLSFDVYLSMGSVSTLEQEGKLAAISDQWNNGTSGYTYVIIKKESFKNQLSAAVSQVSSLLMKNTKVEGKEAYDFEVQPFNDIILGEELAYNLGNTGSRSKMLTEAGICLVLLLSACFNYTNLSLARSLKRGKEVGIRKVAGAFRFQIFYQFIIESLILAFLSFGAAFVLLKLMVHHASFLEMVPAGATMDIGLIKWFVLFTAFTGLLAGILPAWVLSAFKPVEVLKNLANIKLFGSNGLRKTLIVAQFALSLIIIIFTAILYKQFNYMATGDTGFDTRNIISISLQGADHQNLVRDLARLKGVEKISAVSANPGRSASGSVAVKRSPLSEPVAMEFYDVDSNFIANMGLNLIAGNSFIEAKTGAETQVVISDLARKILQFRSPAEAIGKMVWLSDSVQVYVAGVLKDFYYRGLETPYGPLLLRSRPEEFNYLQIKTAVAHDKALMAAAEKLWKKNNPQKLFEANWLHDELMERKGAGGTVSTLGFLALITTTLAGMGLLGMVVYSTETRRKEIGIRKVMGASIAVIIILLSKSFIRLVVVAGLIALPLSYVSGYFFLNLFANRITPGTGLWLWSFACLLVLSLLIICSQIYKVAAENPVKSLSTES